MIFLHKNLIGCRFILRIWETPMSAVIGIALSVVFGGLNVWQWVRGWHKQDKWDSAKVQLEQIRAMCTEAIDRGEAINTDAARQFVRSIAHQIRGIERGLEKKPTGDV